MPCPPGFSVLTHPIGVRLFPARDVGEHFRTGLRHGHSGMTIFSALIFQLQHRLLQPAGGDGPPLPPSARLAVRERDVALAGAQSGELRLDRVHHAVADVVT